MTSKDKGNIALGRAIQYFTSKGYSVLLPLNDAQDYDLAFDDGESIKTVQVKYTSQISTSGNYWFKLIVCGHKNKEGVNYEKIPDYTKINYYFVTTAQLNDYFIPTQDICNKKSYTLNDDSLKYKI